MTNHPNRAKFFDVIIRTHGGITERHYGLSKYAAKQVVAAQQQLGLSVTITPSQNQPAGNNRISR